MYEVLRNQMVQKFVVEAGVGDGRVIESMKTVPRHRFVEPALQHQAYQGGSLPIGFGQTISHPTTVAVMSQLLSIQGGERVLEIGTGSGYQAAVLATMGAKVFTLERIPELAHRAQKLFESLGYYTIAVRIGDGSLGWNEFAPFQRIIVTAGAPEVPPALAAQLAEKGKMILPVGPIDRQKLTVIEKLDGELALQQLDWRNFVPLRGEKGWTL